MEPCYSQAQLCSTFPTPREQHVLSWAVLRIQGGRMASLHSLKHLFVVGVGFFFPSFSLYFVFLVWSLFVCGPQSQIQGK